MVDDLDISPPAMLPARFRVPLGDHGFAAEDGIFRCDELTFSTDGRWLVLSETVSDQGDVSLSADLGHPGLWKWIQNGAPPHRVFEIPAWVVGDAVADDGFAGDGSVLFASLLHWALETRAGRVPSDWEAPAADLVDSWLPRGALTVQTAGLVRQGTLILRPERWALRIPVLPQIPTGLSEPRREALRELAAEARRRWAMVRLGFATELGSSALVAEVDLSGAPHSELLFSAGLDVLRHVVAWLAETVAVLADPAIRIQSLEPGGLNTTNQKERSMP